MGEEENQRLGNLIISLSHGNKETLSEIYKVMCRILYAVGNSYFSCKEDVEDSIQDLLLSLFYKAKKFKENTNACAWIIAVYQNQIKSRLRRRNREDEFLKEETNKFRASADVADTDYLETHIFIKDIFGKLTEYERNLLIYVYWCKCSLGETAKILKKPKSTIQSQLNALKAKIMKF